MKIYVVHERQNYGGKVYQAYEDEDTAFRIAQSLNEAAQQDKYDVSDCELANGLENHWNRRIRYDSGG